MGRRVIAPGRSCFECRRRKIKCDRSLPCSYCVKLKIQCEYSSLPTRRARRQSTVSNVISTANNPHETVRNPRQAFSKDNSLATPPSSNDLLTRGVFLSPVRSFTTLITATTDDSKILPAPTPSSVSAEIPPNAGEFPLSSFPFRLAHLPSLASLHPSSTSRLLLWQTYIDIVDPILKIFHVPTSQRRFIEAIQNNSALDAPTECFMFAVYYAVVATMPASECMSVLKQQKTDLLHQYRSGAEYALLKANFLRSSDLVVLQAFVVFLTFARNSDSELDMQSLVSLAIGNAMRMGLHCEETTSHLSMFEVEMRRRLWWQIYVLDVRIAMECGAQPSIIRQTFNIKKPLNTNDIALDPLLDASPHQADGKTEMTLSLIRIETSELTRRILFSDDFNKSNGYPTLSQAQKCNKIDEMRIEIETRYLVHYSSQIPLDIIASSTARLLFAKLKVMVCKPQANQGGGNPFMENYLALCLDVLKQSHQVRSYRPGRPWSWLFETCVEWDALAYVLLDLCVSPSSADSVTAWNLVEDIYKDWQHDVNLVENRRWRHIQVLWSQAMMATRRAGEAQAPLASQSAISVTPDSSSRPTVFLSTSEQGCPSPAASASIQDGPQCPSLERPGMINAVSMPPALYEDTPIDLSQLPGAGTACEWSALLFEEYWQITE